jgi:ATP/maltotriose-dependent transcriptional regulator MalT
MNTLGGLYDVLGDFNAAGTWSERALYAARSDQDYAIMESERYAMLGLASAELHRGDASAAQRSLDAVEPLLDVTPYARYRYLNRYQLLRAEVALVKGERAQGQRWAEEARSLAQPKNFRKNIAQSWLLAGRALLEGGSLESATDAFRRGIVVADGIQNASLAWQCRLWLAKALEKRRMPEATDVYRAAHQRIDTIISQLPDDHLRDCFSNSAQVQQVRQSVAAITARTKPEVPAGLTPRELEVLRLVASGATNAHVAQVLSISPRTVDVHMTSILSKTGCANRATAVSFALRHGLAELRETS